MTLPWTTLASVATADGQLDLLRRGEKDFLITIDKRVLMTSAAHRSEVVLAELACEGLRIATKARVLVGGLGMGYTLRAALDALASDALVTVCELNPVTVEWCNGPLAPLTANAAADPRVTIEIVDVMAHIAAVGPTKYDAIVLDLYEGPQTRVQDHHPLYGFHALQSIRAALRPSGVLAVWGEARSAGFEQNLAAAGFSFTFHRPGRGGLRHAVYIARSAKGRGRGRPAR